MREKFGVLPESIPDWLALVGDTADGFPGLPGFGAKIGRRAAARYGHIEAIPDDAARVGRPRRARRRPPRGDARRRAARSRTLFKVLATLRTDADVGTVDDWEWTGPTDRPRRLVRAVRLAATRSNARAKLAAHEGIES